MNETLSPVKPRPIRLLPESLAPAERQLAASVGQLAGLGETGLPSMRWYQFYPPALLLGSSQQVEVADLAACAAVGVTLHRRRSGGGAVLSDGLLLLDLALPAQDPLYRHDVTESYRWFAEVWAAALQVLGLGARVVSIAEARADAEALDPLLKHVCFGGLSPYEVMLGGRKLVGLAQVRRQSGALFQAGIHLRWAPERTAALMAAAPTERARLADLLKLRVTGLDEPAMPQRLTAERVKSAVHELLERQAGLVPSITPS